MLVLRTCAMQQVVHLNAILMKNENIYVLPIHQSLYLIVIHITFKKKKTHLATSFFKNSISNLIRENWQ